MSGTERLAVLTGLMRELEEVMRAETTILRSMRLEPLQALQDEKTRLTTAYEQVLRQLRAEPGVMADLDPAMRSALEAAMRGFQDTAQENARRLEAAQGVVEGVVRTIGRALAPRTAYTRSSAGAPREAQIVALAVNRQA